jgi:hypothetical protein
MRGGEARQGGDAVRAASGDNHRPLARAESARQTLRHRFQQRPGTRERRFPPLVARR